MSAEISTLTWAVVAAEDDPARAEWSRAAGETGVAEPRFVPWSAVLSSEAEFQPGEVVVAERLHPRTAPNPVGGHDARYVELQAALEQLEALAAKAGAVLATSAEQALLALDRTKCDDFLRQNGVPVLDPGDPSTPDSSILRPRYAGSDDWMIDGWRTQLFKHHTRDGFEVWRAVGRGSGDRQEIHEIVAALAGDGIHAVTALHRVHLINDFYDIRVAVLDGKATHAAGVLREGFVLREWYGGKRLELDAFLERFGAERWERVVRLAERAATYFPGIRSLGVDLIMDNHDAEYVFDVDPFGAFLPGLVGGLPNAEGEPATVRAAVLRLLSGGS